ncbi:MAG: hypothetical protein DMG09_09400, partial [Acidobacteria bacterium]
KLIREERRRLMLLDVPDRWDLWHAALKMFLSRPLLGAGPDNFRLLKWKYMKAQKGDETILANSLYLEYLANSGIAGLASLLWLVVEFAKCLGQKLRLAEESRDRGVAFFGVAFFAAFLTHGLVDYFLKFTPAFLLFWLIMGVLNGERRAGADLGHERMHSFTTLFPLGPSAPPPLRPLLPFACVLIGGDNASRL